MNHHPSPPARLGRVLILGAVFLPLFAMVGFRLHHLQVVEQPRLAELADAQQERTRTLPAPRGNLYDASGAPLCVSEAAWILGCDARNMEDRLRATVELANVLGCERDELRRHFESDKNGRTLARGLSDAQADAVRELKLSGIWLRREFTRSWPAGAVAPHVIGFVNADGHGGAGIEQALDGRLIGTPGRETLSVDARNRPVLTADGGVIDALPGASIQLTLDLAIQLELERALAEAGEKHAPRGGCAGLVVRPATGEIVAMASWPTFDPIERSNFTPEAIGNKAVSLVYEPGSTMKPLIAGAAVADRLTSWQERIDCEHGRWTHRVGRGARTVSEKTGGHGVLSVTDGIAYSDNILMAKLGIRLGPERLRSWVERFNFGHRLGLGLPGEGAGILPTGRAWNELDACMSVPMGHAIAVTPLQMAMAHAAVANRGLWMPPRLVRRIALPDGRSEEPAPAGSPLQMFADADAARIEEAMTHVLTEGTGKRVQLEGYAAAGKTGTTEKLVDGRYSSGNNIGSFVCWAPAQPGARVEDKLLCLVVVDDPTKNGRFGADTAAPVVQRVLQYALERQRIPQAAKTEPAKDEAPSTRASKVKARRAKR